MNTVWQQAREILLNQPTYGRYRYKLSSTSKYGAVELTIVQCSHKILLNYYA